MPATSWTSPSRPSARAPSTPPGSLGGGGRDPAKALRREDRLAPWPVLCVRGRHAGAATAAAAVPDLDRVEPDGAHVEGRRVGVRAGRRARLPPRRALRRRLDAQQALPPAAPPAAPSPPAHPSP